MRINPTQIFNPQNLGIGIGPVPIIVSLWLVHCPVGKHAEENKERNQQEKKCGRSDGMEYRTPQEM